MERAAHGCVEVRGLADQNGGREIGCQSATVRRVSELNDNLPIRTSLCTMCLPNSFFFKMSDVPKHVSFKNSLGFGVSRLLQSCTTSPSGTNSLHVLCPNFSAKAWIDRGALLGKLTRMKTTV